LLKLLRENYWLLFSGHGVEHTLYRLQKIKNKNKKTKIKKFRCTQLNKFTDLKDYHRPILKSERLRKLNLRTLKYRRLSGDMIELFKMLSGNYSKDACVKFKFVDREVNRSRGNTKLFQDHVLYKTI